jgi:hypothetical protein
MTLGKWGSEREIRADVFVSALQTCRDHAAYDALDLAQWHFYVVPAARLSERGTRSVSLAWVQRQVAPVALPGLAAAIETAGRTVR